MKKILFLILTFIGIGISFCSAGEITAYCSNSDFDNCYNYLDIDFPAGDYVFDFSFLNGPSCNSFSIYITDPYFISVDSNRVFISLSSPVTSNVEFGCIGASAFDGNFSLVYNFVPLSTGGGSTGGDSTGGDSTGTIPDIPGGNEPSVTPPSPYNGNIIESISGATVQLSDSALASGIGEPMFFWYGQLLNIAVKFFPVVVVVSMFWLIYGYLKNLGNKNSLESKKSLDNK